MSLSEFHLLPQEKGGYRIRVGSKLYPTVITDNFKTGTFCTPIPRGDRGYVSKLLVPEPLMSIPVFTFGWRVRRHLRTEEVVVWLGREMCLAVHWATKWDCCIEQYRNTTPSCKQCSNSLQLGFLRGGGGVFTPLRMSFQAH